MVPCPGSQGFGSAWQDCKLHEWSLRGARGLGAHGPLAGTAGGHGGLWGREILGASGVVGHARTAQSGTSPAASM